jgi:drug/metabolite transporter (DMT)-like permease
MLLGAMAFATMGALAHALAATCDWQIVALARTMLALTFATVLTLAAGARLVLWNPPILWMRSIAGSISLVCTFYALPRMPVADVLTLTNVFPVWVALLSWPVLGEAPTRQAWIAIVLGLAGVALVEQPHLASEQSTSALPAVAALVSSFTSAIAMLGLHRLQNVDPRAIVAHFSGVAMAVCLAGLVLVPNTAIASTSFTPWSVGMLLGVGISATTGQLFLTKAFAAGPPAKVSVVALTQVVFAALFDVVITRHAIGPVTLAGMALVVAPTAWLLLSRGEPAAGDL